MAIHVIEGSLMSSDTTGHEAKSAGLGGWTVSFLPGRTLTIEQANAAMLVAENITAIATWAGQLGLTVREVVGMAIDAPQEPKASSRRSFSRSARR